MPFSCCLVVLLPWWGSAGGKRAFLGLGLWVHGGVSTVWLSRHAEQKGFRRFLAKFSSWALISTVSFSLKILSLKTRFSVPRVLVNL